MARVFARLRLAEAYKRGEFVREIGEEVALKWHQKAAEDDDNYSRISQRKLGWAYEHEKLSLEIDLEASLM